MTIDHEAILRRAHQNMARTEEMLSEPRTVPTYEPPAPTRYRGFELESYSDMLKDTEARLNKRIDELEGRIQGMWQGVEGLADETEKATGELEKRLRDEMRKEVESLRSEVSLLRAKAGTPQGPKAISRAPWKDIDASLTSN